MITKNCNECFHAPDDSDSSPCNSCIANSHFEHLPLGDIQPEEIPLSLVHFVIKDQTAPKPHWAGPVDMNFQPAPKANANPAIWSCVMADMVKRDITGYERYGVRLQANNGRDMLQDAYEEALDLACYLRGAIFERDGK